MSLAFKDFTNEFNRNESFKNLNIKGLQREVYQAISYLKTCTPEQVWKNYFPHKKLRDVHPRFTELRKMGYIKIIMSVYNKDTAKKNSVYQVMNHEEQIDYSIKKGVEIQDRKAEIETELNLGNAIGYAQEKPLSKETRKWLKKRLEDLVRTHKNLVTV